ncbi:MAG: hypothetical protein K2P81_07980 [Bacteriovoracaceae bacterium]|nr:hypothetical protein [Bacteriovoracaceae bacterium]
MKAFFDELGPGRHQRSFIVCQKLASPFLVIKAPDINGSRKDYTLQIEPLQNQSHVSCLREIVQDFLNRHPRLTVQALSQRANVPVTTLRRLLQVESKSEIAPHTALNLCSYIFREKRVGPLLKLLPALLSQYLEKHFGAFVFEGAEERTYSLELNEILKDRMSYFIYKLAANRSGTSWIEITELFGSTGKKKTEELIQAKVLKIVEEKIHACDSDFSLDLKVASSHLPELVKFYRPEDVSRGLNLMYSLSESLNEEAIQKIKNIQREAVKATHEIMKSAESNGSIPYFTLNICESFSTENQGTLQ